MLLETAYQSLTAKGRRKSTAIDFNLTSKQLAMVYEGLQGNTLPFALLLGTTDYEKKERIKPRIGIRRSEKGKFKVRKNDTFKALCPVIPAPVPKRNSAKK